jgi:hypothetical protein
VDTGFNAIKFYQEFDGDLRFLLNFRVLSTSDGISARNKHHQEATNNKQEYTKRIHYLLSPAIPFLHLSCHRCRTVSKVLMICYDMLCYDMLCYTIKLLQVERLQYHAYILSLYEMLVVSHL